MKNELCREEVHIVPPWTRGDFRGVLEDPNLAIETPHREKEPSRAGSHRPSAGEGLGVRGTEIYQVLRVTKSVVNIFSKSQQEPASE